MPRVNFWVTPWHQETVVFGRPKVKTPKGLSQKRHKNVTEQKRLAEKTANLLIFLPPEAKKLKIYLPIQKAIILHNPT